MFLRQPGLVSYRSCIRHLVCIHTKMSMSPGSHVRVIVNMNLHVFQWQPFTLIQVQFALAWVFSVWVLFLGNLYVVYE